jgi:uncharacterized protein (TIGR02246 family)
MSIRLEAQALMDRYAQAYRTGDAAGCAALFTEGATLYSPYSGAARGRDAIEALHRVWTEHESDSKTLTVLDAGSSGDLGWCLAAYSGGEVTDNGTSLNILARLPDGRWLILMCSLNADEPPLAQA